MPHDTHIAEALIEKPLKDRSSLEKSGAFVAIGLTLLMIGLKLYGWAITDSLSILSSLTDSLMDLLVSGINLVAIYYALKPADDDHRYGHTAIEDIAGFFQASMLVGTSLLISVEAISRFFNPVSASPKTDLALVIMVICFFLTLCIVLYQRFVVYKSKSIIVEADSLHYLSDLATTFGVLASLYLWQYYDLGWIDPLISLAIVAVILWGAIQIGHQSYKNLMDTEMSDEDRAAIIDTINSHEGHAGFHDLRTRQSGRKVFIQLHLELDKRLSLTQAQDIAEALEDKLEELFRDADVIVHQDPV